MNLKYQVLIILFNIFLLSGLGCMEEKNTTYVLAIHGGAGTILREEMTPAKKKAYVDKLTEAIQAGYDQIQQGKRSVDAVVTVIEILENSPLFNAGKGAVFTNEGKNELDASIMDGSTLNAGAVAGLTHIKNPIKAARAVMEKSKHVMLSGKGAEIFAISEGIDTVPSTYFFTQERWDALQRALLRNEVDKQAQNNSQSFIKQKKFGTVGAVALDQAGNLAAGTSTGGLTNKQYGRVGDVPVIGAGTYANETVAVSCTGQGEYFIRAVAAYQVYTLMKHNHMTLEEATSTTIANIKKLGGTGGMIGLDKDGNVALPFSTKGMYRATATKDGKIEVAMYE